MIILKFPDPIKINFSTVTFLNPISSHFKIDTNLNYNKMKTYTLIIALSICMMSFSQDEKDTVANSKDNKPEKYGYVVEEETGPIEDDEELDQAQEEIEIEEEALAEDEPKSETVNKDIDTVRLKFKNHEITIVDKTGKMKSEEYDFEEMEKDNKSDDYEWDSKKRHKFEGHWEGLEIGLPNLVDKDYNLTRTPAEAFMDLNTSKSWNANLNFSQQEIRLLGNWMGLVTGAGVQLNYYYFDNNNSITKNSTTGYIESLKYLNNNSQDTIDLKRSKLSSIFLTVPLLIEFQPIKGPKDKNLYISCGVEGQLKLGSSTKVVYFEDGDKKRKKDKGDFNLNPFRYAYVVRLGYGDFGVYGMYYPVSLFEKDKGPELYPVSLGISFTMD